MTKGLISFFFNTPILSPSRRLYEPEAITPLLQGRDFQELWHLLNYLFIGYNSEIE